MTPIQQLMLGVGASKKTYLDDVFSTYVYKGPVSNNRIYNNINLTDNGGLVWIKHRDTINNISEGHYLFDSERSYIQLTANASTEQDQDDFAITVNTDGFNVNGHSRVGGSGQKFTSFTYRKSKGFFDCITFTGSGSNRAISHQLGCVPGMILVKRTDSAADWKVYHRGVGATKHLTLNENYNAGTHSSYWQDTAPTSSVFYLGTDGDVNGANNSYVAYLFSGGESSDAAARSCDFSGSNYLELDDHADFHFGGGAFTVECWIKGTANNSNRNIIGQWASGQMGWSVFWAAGNQGHSAWGFKWGTSGSNEYQVSDILLDDDQWHHIAVSCDGNNLWLYRDGIQRKKIDFSSEDIHNSTAACRIANDGWNSPLDCHISNVRVVKGSAVYTTSFRVPTEPLTNITNTKLLCCNGTTPTFATVQPGYASLTNNGSVTSSTVTPFDDTASFKFGGDNKEGITKSGSYVGSGSAGLEVNLGWEPQWLMVKNASTSSTSWTILDSMRGIITGTNDTELYVDTGGAETNTNGNRISLTATGFILNDTASYFNSDGDTYIYYAIRRSDGYVGKPMTATDVFVPTLGNGSATIPSLPSTFPVDFCLYKDHAATTNWATTARLTGGAYMKTNLTDLEASTNEHAWDSMVGCHAGTWLNSNDIGYLWKRHAGFDVVTWEGTNGNVERSHNLAKIPEMIIFKNRDAARSWRVYHKGLNGGTNPEDYAIALNSSTAEGSNTSYMDGTAPTSTHFVAGNDGDTNALGDSYIALLFASVEGVSSVGFYDGSNANQTITTGFQPRFIIIKNATNSAAWSDWMVFDSARNLGSGNEGFLHLNDSDSEVESDLIPSISSTGFTVGTNSTVNYENDKFIFYAHA